MHNYVVQNVQMQAESELNVENKGKCRSAEKEWAG